MVVVIDETKKYGIVKSELLKGFEVELVKVSKITHDEALSTLLKGRRWKSTS